ncbi:M20 aminoacylase family protein [Mesorhizobium sp. M7A.F.Ca.MR.148.00.0.0]|uniref:M20 aminoacylase family protein n=1 Tax=Mesorhizobium sp. M7A.F.Ca.MR.148.00.0.0 TaxID=2496775 RepID=UPI000FCA34E9|nr:M20 aminoacylase family protein [Mesorhizobium sp. M7A.F.Ca.MR.148.00.0.0]RUV36166.1 amidohydrolase [Mesorhizobium sp. M7A.F.Ca.MR.148.00.0.0]
MRLVPSVQQLETEMTAWRRHLHANPELGFEEFETTRFVADKLRSWGIETTEGVGRTGVVGTLRGRLGAGRSLGIRADMDALPMTEARPLPHASRIPGRMHGCGHDGHTTMLLGAASALARSPDFAGTVHFIFQPAEEGRGGALAMLNDGLFERFPCDEVYALHNCERPLGEIAVHRGTVAAAADRFEMVVHGRGGHAAMPHLAINPLPVAARILLAIEALPGRLTDVHSPAIVTVGSLRAGEAFNTIPDAAFLTGTVRTFDHQVQKTLEMAIRRIAKNEAEAFGASVDIRYETPFAPTINTQAQADAMIAIANEVMGSERLVVDPPPEMGSEDFCYMLEQRPGCYFLLGQADDAHQAAAHDTNYDFNDAILPMGASLWVRLVERRLSAAGAS